MLLGISLGFLVVTAAVGPLVWVVQLGLVQWNLLLTALGLLVYGLTALLARAGRVDAGASLSGSGIAALVFCTSQTVAWNSPFLFLGTMTPLLVSLVGSRQYLVPLTVLNLGGVLLLGLLAPESDTLAFYPALFLTHCTTATVGWFTSTRNTVAFTEVMSAKEQLEEALAAVEHANRTKSAFLANMSHELRTPLNAILGYTELLAEELGDDRDPDDPSLHDLTRVQQSATHLLNLINDLLDLSKVEAGKLDVECIPIDLATLLSEIQADAERLVRPGVRFQLEGAGSTVEGLRGDPLRTRQILLNLISNAAKFTHEGAVRLEVTHDGAWLALAVHDSGIGIPADKLASIFDGYSQAEVSTTREYGGTGLGLSLSRQLAEKLGGELTVASVTGQGSTFTLRLPLGG